MGLNTPELAYGRVRLKPLNALDRQAWRRVHTHFRDPEISHLNGTPPSRMQLWLLRRILRADSYRRDRETFGIFDEADAYIGTIELYDLRPPAATLGIIIGEKSHWSRGYGPEAIRALLDHAFRSLGLERVRLNTFGDNLRAQAAFKKVGFEEVRRGRTVTGRTDIHMVLTRAAWQAAQAAAEPPLPPQPRAP